jgi:hypothetical protein
MYQIDLYNAAVAKNVTVYSKEIDLAKYDLPAWQFALYHIHAGTAGSTLTLVNQYSYDKSTWIDGATLLTTGAIGSAMVAVDEATINKLYPIRYFRIKITVLTQNASSVFLSLGMA